MSDSPAFLVFDIETIVDGRLVQRVRYPGEPELTPAQAVAKYRAEISAQTGGKSDFVPHTFHVPVSIAIAKVAEDHSLIAVKTLDRPKFRPQAIVRAFWRGWEKYGRPTLVTFNGRFFDLPVLELAAYRYGISVPAWFQSDGPSYNQPRNRYNSKAHLDVQDFLGNAGATHMNGGLNLCSKLVGAAGKMDTKGDQVQALWEAGERERIDDYCMTDALDTYFVFLRCRVLQGLLTIEAEAKLIAHARAWVEEQSTRSLALAQWLQRSTPWTAVSDDEDPVLL